MFIFLQVYHIFDMNTRRLREYTCIYNFALIYLHFVTLILCFLTPPHGLSFLPILWHQNVSDKELTFESETPYCPVPFFQFWPQSWPRDSCMTMHDCPSLGYFWVFRESLFALRPGPGGFGGPKPPGANRTLTHPYGTWHTFQNHFAHHPSVYLVLILSKLQTRYYSRHINHYMAGQTWIAEPLAAPLLL
jgi:hypothetical protein